MEDLIIAILQGLFEFLLEIFSSIPFDLPSIRRGRPEPETVASKCCLWCLIGAGMASLSILFLKHTWISHPALRIANLIVAPLASAFISEAIARRRSRKNPFIIPRNHFWQAFWFTFGIVFIRFAYAIPH